MHSDQENGSLDLIRKAVLALQLHVELSGRYRVGMSLQLAVCELCFDLTLCLCEMQF